MEELERIKNGEKDISSVHEGLVREWIILCQTQSDVERKIKDLEEQIRVVLDPIDAQIFRLSSGERISKKPNLPKKYLSKDKIILNLAEGKRIEDCYEEGKTYSAFSYRLLKERVNG